MSDDLMLAGLRKAAQWYGGNDGDFLNEVADRLTELHELHAAAKESYQILAEKLCELSTKFDELQEEVVRLRVAGDPIAADIVKKMYGGTR